MPSGSWALLCDVLGALWVSKMALPSGNYMSVLDMKINVSRGPLGANIKNLMGTWHHTLFPLLHEDYLESHSSK